MKRGFATTALLGGYGSLISDKDGLAWEQWGQEDQTSLF